MPRSFVPFTLTVCGIEELPAHSELGVSHVLSILDPEHPELEVFGSYGEHERLEMRFHDIIEDLPGQTPPRREHVKAILEFGNDFAAAAGSTTGHLLIHCHMGVSRSSAAMLAIMAEVSPAEDEDRLLARLREIRPRAWPNSLMLGWVDEMLGREGRLTAALGRHYACQIARDPELVEALERFGRGSEVELGRRAGLPLL